MGRPSDPLRDIINLVANVRDTLTLEQQDILSKVGRGDAKSFDEYRHMVGQIKGIERSKELLVEQRRLFLKGDDDDE